MRELINHKIISVLRWERLARANTMAALTLSDASGSGSGTGTSSEAAIVQVSGAFAASVLVLTSSVTHPLCTPTPVY